MKKQFLKNKENNKKNTGITLIALVVTIIVLLILAGISINSISGNNSILKRAHDAKEQTIIGQEKEQVELAYITAAMKKLGDNVTSEELQHELDLSVGANKTQVAGQETLDVLFTDTNHSYKIKNGTATKTEIFDANDGIYIVDQNEIKVSPKIQVPKKDEIVSDIVIKGHDGDNFQIYGENSTPPNVGQVLCDLAMLNSDYLDVLRELRYIDDDFESFLKNKKSNIDRITINGIPMFEIVKKADNEYYITVKWDYVLAKDSTQNLFESKVCISSKISFTNSDYTSYDLGDITVEENNTTSDDNAPFKGISNIENGTVITDRFLLKYNNKEYRGKEGLKDFLDNIVGLKNKEIAKTYVDVGEIIYALKNTSGNFDEQQVEQKIRTYFPLPIQNANILEKYVAKSNSLDGIYIKGQRITSKIQKNISSEEIRLVNNYIGALGSLLYNFGYFDVEAYDYLLSRELIDPLILSTVLNSKLAYSKGNVRLRNLLLGYVYLDSTGDDSFDVEIYGGCANVTLYLPMGEEIYDLDLDLNLRSSCNIETDTETGARRISWSDVSVSPESHCLSLFHHFGWPLTRIPSYNESEVNWKNLISDYNNVAEDKIAWEEFESWLASASSEQKEGAYYELNKIIIDDNHSYTDVWEDFRKKGILSSVNENILPFPDKDEFLTIANEYVAKEAEVAEGDSRPLNERLSKYKSSSHNLNDEVDLYTSVYSAIIHEAFENGTYEIRSDGKTYTGKDALKNFLIKEYGFDDADKIIQYKEYYEN